MQYKEININQAVGTFLCSDMMLGEKFYPKGHRITAEDVIIFKLHELRFIFVAIYETGDVEFTTAAHQIAAQICGASLGYLTENGICKISAAKDGIFIADENRLDKFNSFNEDIILNTIAPYSLVKAGDIVATLEVIPPFLSSDSVDDMIFRLSGGTNLLHLSEVSPQKAVLVYPHLQNDEAENRHFTSVVMKLITNLNGLEIEFQQEINSRYNKENIADSLFDAFALNPDVVFVLTPLRSSGRHDVLASGLKLAVDEIVCGAFPQVGASDLLIGQKGRIKVVVIPYGYDAVDNTAADRLIKRTLFEEHLTGAFFTRQRAGHLKPSDALDEKQFSRLIMPQAKTVGSKKASVGIVVLAAGQGKRSGCNKLMIEDKDGFPLFMHAVNAAVKSDARPVFVVTGYRHDEMEEYLDKLDVNVLYNQSYTAGIKTSINMGLKSIPSSCDGAILLPADMPYIEASHLNKLIAKFDKTAPKQVCMLSHKGIKSNPILWSKSLYDKADIVPENAQLRVVFAEHADYSKLIEIKDAAKLGDVNFPHDVEEFCKG